MERQAVMDALNSTLGRYIVDLDTPSLSLSLRSGGKIEFPRGLKLNADAINRDYLCPDCEYDDDDASTPSSSSKTSHTNEGGGFLGNFRRRRQQRRQNCEPPSSQSMRRRSPLISQTESYSQEPGGRRQQHRSSCPHIKLDESILSSFDTDEASHQASAMAAAPAPPQSLSTSSRSCSTSPKDYLKEDWVINVNGHNRRKKSKHPRRRASSSFLDGLSLPNNVRVKSGYIHELSIEIPWRALANRPIVVKITGVKLVLEPIVDPKKSVRRERNRNYQSNEFSSAKNGNSTMRRSISQCSFSRAMHEHEKSMGNDKSSQYATANEPPPEMATAVIDIGGMGAELFNNKILRSFTFADKLQREILLKRKNREEEMVRKRRRIIMQRKDERRKRHGVLRRIIFPSTRSEGDDSKDKQGGCVDGNVTGFWSRLRSSVSFNGGQGQKSGEQLKESLRRRVLENLQLDVNGVHLQLIGKAKEHANTRRRGASRRSSRGSMSSFGSIETESVQFPDNGGNGFVLGIVLERLSIEEANDNEGANYLNRSNRSLCSTSSYASLSSGNGKKKSTDNFSVRKLQISDFGVYVKEGTDGADGAFGTDIGSGYNNSHLSGYSMETSVTSGVSSMQNFVVNPLSFEVIFQKRSGPFNRNVQGDAKNPVHLISVELSHLSILLSKFQLNLVNEITKSLSIPPTSCLDNCGQAKNENISSCPSPLFPEYRPACSITCLTVVEWWRYAVACILRIKGGRSQRLWVDFMVAFRKRKRYITLYCRYLVVNDPSFWNRDDLSDAIRYLQRRLRITDNLLDDFIPLSEQETAEMHSIEDDWSLSIEAVLQWRALVEALVQEEIEKWRLSTPKCVDKKVVLSEECKGGGKTEEENIQLPHTRLSRNGSGSGVVSGILGWASRKETKESGKVEETLEGDECVTELLISQKELNDLEFQLKKLLTEPTKHIGSLVTRVDFFLGFVVVDLTHAQECPIAKLRLWTLEMSYTMAVGRSKSFMCSLSSLQLEDTMSINPVLPSVVRSVHLNPSGSSIVDDSNPPLAFLLSLKVSQDGDKELMLQMIALEIVAATDFFKELSDFFCVQNSDSNHEPVLGTISGPIENGSFPKPAYHSFLTNLLSDAVANHFQNAWKGWSNTHSGWSLSLNIDAPLFVIPDNFESNNPSVLVIDFGHHQLRSTTDVLNSPIIQSWLCDNEFTEGGGDIEQHPEFDQVRLHTPKIADMWRLVSTDIAVMTGTARGCEWVLRKDPKASGKEQSSFSPDLIIDPFSLTVDFVTGSSISRVKRMCPTSGHRTFVSVSIPSLDVSLTPGIFARLTSALPHFEFMVSFLKASSRSIVEERITFAHDNDKLFCDELNIPLLTQSRSSNGGTTVNPPDKKRAFHLSAYLGRFACKMEIVQGALEAFLVSVKYSFDFLRDESITSRFQVGWAWVLDGLDDNRGKKMFLNGALPNSVSPTFDYFSDDLDSSDVSEHKMPSINTVDITFRDDGRGIVPHGDTLKGHRKNVSLLVRFSELFFHWYPDTVEQLICLQKVVENEIVRLEKPAKSSVLLDKMSGHGEVDTDNESTGYTSTVSSFASSTSDMFSLLGFDAFWQSLRDATLYPSELKRVTVKLEVTAVEVKFHRDTKDDTPYLFMALILGTFFELTVQGETRFKVMIEVNRASFEAGQVKSSLPDYHKIIFRDNTESTSFFSLRHLREIVDKTENEPREFRGRTIINISPVKLSYLHPQLHSLAKYMKQTDFECILSSALTPIFTYFRDACRVHSIQQVIELKISEVLLQIPQSIESRNVFTISTGIVYKFTSLPYYGGGEGKLNLKSFTVICAKKQPLLHDKLDLFVFVDLSPIDDMENMQVQVTKLKLFLASTSVSLNKQQYAQLMTTLLWNLEGLTSSFRFNNHYDGADSSLASCRQQSMERESGLIKKIEIDARFDAISITLCSLEEANDPLLSLRIEKAKMLVQSMSSTGSLHVYGSAMHAEIINNTSSERHQIRKVLKQVYGDKSKGPFVWFKLDKGGSKADLSIVFRCFEINLHPDIFSEMTQFVDISPLSRSVKTSKANTNYCGGDSVATVQENCSQLDLASEKLFVLSLKIATSRIVIFEDFVLDAERTRCLVFQGCGSVTKSKESTTHRNAISNKTEFDGEIEVFKAFGTRMMDPIQIMDPTNYSVQLNSTKCDAILKKEINVVSMLPIDLTLSVQDASLLMSIYEFIIRQNIAGGQPGGDKDGGEKSDLKIRNIDTQVSIIMPSATIVLIDDLDCHDRPLFKVTIENALIESRSLPTFSSPTQRDSLHIRFCSLAQFFNIMDFRWSALTNRCNVSMLLERDVEKPTTKLYFECHPCHFSISEQLLCNVDRLLFSLHPKINQLFDRRDGAGPTINERFPTSYGVQNLTGVIIHYSLNDDVHSEPCEVGQTKFFSFGLAPTSGVGGKRLYGQDSNIFKSVTLCVGNSHIIDEFSTVISISNIDNVARCVHTYGNNRIIVIDTETTKRASKVLTLRSRVVVHNFTMVPFGLKVKDNAKYSNIGQFQEAMPSKQAMYDHTRPYETIGLPSSKMSRFDSSDSKSRKLSLRLCLLKHFEGALTSNEKIEIPCINDLKRKVTPQKPYMIMCHINLVGETKLSAANKECIGIKTITKTSIVNGNPIVDIYIQPRGVIQNDLPLTVLIRAPSLFVFGGVEKKEENSTEEDVSQRTFVLSPGKDLQIFAPNESIDVAICFQCSKSEYESDTDWTDPKSTNIPLDVKSYSLETTDGSYVDATDRRFSILSKSNFYQDHRNHGCQEMNSLFSSSVFSFGGCNILVDHTDGFSVMCASKSKSFTLDSFLYSGCRLTFVPRSIEDLIIFRKGFKLTKRSQSLFMVKIEDIPLVKGGIESVPLYLKNGISAGCYAFREELSPWSNSYRIHIINEYAIINETDAVVSFLNYDSQESMFVIDSGETFAFSGAPTKSHVFSLSIQTAGQDEYIVKDFQMEKLGGKQFQLTSASTNTYVGSLFVQIMPGGRNARKRVEIKPIQYGETINEITQDSRRCVNFLKGSMIARLRMDTIQVLLLDSLDSNVPGRNSFSFSFHGVKLEYCRLYRQHRTNKDEVERSQFLFDTRLSFNIGRLEFDDCKKDVSAETMSPPDKQFLNLRIYATGSDDSNVLDVHNMDCCMIGSESRSKLAITSSCKMTRMLGSVMDWISPIWMFSNDASAKELRQKILTLVFLNETFYKFNRVQISPVHIELQIDTGAQEDTDASGDIDHEHPSILSSFTNHQETASDLIFGEISARNINGSLNLLISILKSVYSARLRSFYMSIKEDTSSSLVIDEQKTLKYLFDLITQENEDIVQCNAAHKKIDIECFMSDLDHALLMIVDTPGIPKLALSEGEIQSVVQEANMLENSFTSINEYVGTFLRGLGARQ